MRALIQRVSEAEVRVDGQVTASIGRGLLVFLGVGHDDDEREAARLWKKIRHLRIFPDAAGRTNLNLEQVNGSVLIVSQFTLFADTRRGNRPGFTDSAAPDRAQALYEYVLQLARADGLETAGGVFGAHMEVSLVNDGPFTIWLDSAAWS